MPTRKQYYDYLKSFKSYKCNRGVCGNISKMKKNELASLAVKHGWTLQRTVYVPTQEERTAGAKTRKKSDKPRKANPWIVHLKQFRSENPNMSYKVAMQEAKKTYKKGSRPSPVEAKAAEPERSDASIGRTSEPVEEKKEELEEKKPENDKEKYDRLDKEVKELEKKVDNPTSKVTKAELDTLKDKRMEKLKLRKKLFPKKQKKKPDKDVTGGAITMGDVAKFATGAMSFAKWVDKNWKGVQEFDGERHIPLWVNGSVKIPNYMGSGTNLIERLRRGDQGVSFADKISKLHDIRYMEAQMAETKEEMRRLKSDADREMLDYVRRAKEQGLDNKVNLGLAKLGIEGKQKAEDILPNFITNMLAEKFTGDLEQYSEDDIKLSNDARDATIQELNNALNGDVQGGAFRQPIQDDEDEDMRPIQAPARPIEARPNQPIAISDDEEDNEEGDENLSNDIDTLHNDITTMIDTITNAEAMQEPQRPIGMVYNNYSQRIINILDRYTDDAITNYTYNNPNLLNTFNRSIYSPVIMGVLYRNAIDYDDEGDDLPRTREYYDSGQGELVNPEVDDLVEGIEDMDMTGGMFRRKSPFMKAAQSIVWDDEVTRHNKKEKEFHKRLTDEMRAIYLTNPPQKIKEKLSSLSIQWKRHPPEISSYTVEDTLGYYPLTNPDNPEERPNIYIPKNYTGKGLNEDEIKATDNDMRKLLEENERLENDTIDLMTQLADMRGRSIGSEQARAVGSLEEVIRKNEIIMKNNNQIIDSMSKELADARGRPIKFKSGTKRDDAQKDDEPKSPIFAEKMKKQKRPTEADRMIKQGDDDDLMDFLDDQPKLIEQANKDMLKLQNELTQAEKEALIVSGDEDKELKLLEKVEDIKQKIVNLKKYLKQVKSGFKKVNAELERRKQATSSKGKPSIFGRIFGKKKDKDKDDTLGGSLKMKKGSSRHHNFINQYAFNIHNVVY